MPHKFHGLILAIWWLLVLLVGLAPWWYFFGGEMWSVIRYKNHHVFLMCLVFIMATAFAGAMRLGFLSGLKILVNCSATAFLLAISRGLLLQRIDADCSSICFGFVNEILGIGCGSAGEGCATEFFLLAFFSFVAITIFFKKLYK